MKKILVLLLLFVYSFSTIGATLHVHYCMGKPMNVSLSENKNKVCGKCGMKDTLKKGCCHDEKKEFKIKNDYKKTNGFNFFNLTDVCNTHPYYTYQNIASTHSVVKCTVVYSPPPNLLLKNWQVWYCTFLI